MGHSTITMTVDRYGHLMPGNEDEAAVMLGAYSSETVVASCPRQTFLLLARFGSAAKFAQRFRSSSKPGAAEALRFRESVHR